jgi:hypothetical protein
MKNGNITGEVFDTYVREQIEARQKKLGATQRTNKDLTWLSSKTAFLRLSSATNVSPTIANALGYPNYDGDKLAKSMILYGGAITIDNTSTIKGGASNFRQGIGNPGDGNIGNYAYEYDPIQKGYRPTPGLQGAEIGFYNRGSLSKVQIKIKAFSVNQLQLLDVLYLRVGYTLLLEWGHNIYLDNKGNIQNRLKDFNTKPFEKIFDGKEHDQFEMLDSIKSEREIACGNYDAFYGKVTNFSWTLLADGTYDITVNCISLGDVIESLRVNQSIDLVSVNNTSPLVLSQNSNQITNFEFPKLSKLAPSRDEIARSSVHLWIEGLKSTLDKSSSNSQGNLYQKFEKLPESVISGGTVNNWLLKISNNDQEQHYYVKLGFILKFIEENLLFYSKPNNTKTPYFKIDYNFDNNYFLRTSSQISADPRVCLVLPMKYEYSTGGDAWNFLNYLQLPDNQLQVIDNPYIGKLMHIHVNLRYIESIMDEAISNPEGTKLFDFIKKILEGINNSLGGINKLSPIYDSLSNTLKILEEAPLQYAGIRGAQKISKFRTRGVLPDIEGSFLYDVNFNVNISNNFATMAAIGAQANQNSILENSTALSAMNVGLTDRVIVDKLDNLSFSIPPSQPTGSSQLLITTFEQLQKIGGEIYANLKWTDTSIGNLTELNKQYQEYETVQLAKDNIIPAPFFLPFHLDITMEGLSGMRNYERFNITDEFLPDTYRDGNRFNGAKALVNFLITGLSHTISDNKWVTKINSLTVPAEPDPNNIKLKPAFAPAQTASPALQEEVKNRIKQAVNFFISKGFPRYKAIAAVAAIQGESETLNPLDTNNAGGGSGAFGIAQWRGTRLVNLKTQPNYQTFEGQLEFLYKELTPGNAYTDKISQPYIKKEKDPEYMLAAMAIFERWDYPVQLYKQKGSYDAVHDILYVEIIRGYSPDKSLMKRISFMKNIETIMSSPF